MWSTSTATAPQCAQRGAAANTARRTVGHRDDRRRRRCTGHRTWSVITPQPGVRHGPSDLATATLPAVAAPSVLSVSFHPREGAVPQLCGPHGVHDVGIDAEPQRDGEVCVFSEEAGAATAVVTANVQARDD